MLIFNMKSSAFRAAALLLLLFTPDILCSSSGVGLTHHQQAEERGSDVGSSAGIDGGRHLDDHMDDELTNKVRDCINAIIISFFQQVPHPLASSLAPSFAHIPVLLSLRDLPCILSLAVHDNDGEYGGVLASSSSYISREGAR